MLMIIFIAAAMAQYVQALTSKLVSLVEQKEAALTLLLWVR